MQSNRRTVLRYGAACLALGVAGCTDDQGVEYPDDGETDATPPTEGENGQDDGDAADDEEGAPDEEDTEAEEEGRREPEYDVTIGPLTDGIVDEAGWFAREHGDAVDAFLEEVGSIIDTIESLEAMTSVTESNIETLEGAAARVEGTAETRLEPHFSIESYVRRINTRHLSDVRRHGGRGDQEALEVTLESYRREYSRMRTQSFVDEWFPIDPIENRLLDWLKSPWLLREIGGDSAFDPRPVFELRYVGNVTFSSFAYSDGARSTADDPFLRGDPARVAGGSALSSVDESIEDVFRVVSERSGRRDELYVVANEWRPQAERRYTTQQLPSWPIYVQRYRSPEDADAAVQALFDGPVFLADVGHPTFADEQWEQIFYRRAGRVRYAAMARDGPVVVVTAPSRTPIEDRDGFGTVPDVSDSERTHWARPLTYTWLWNDTTMPTGGDE